MEVTTTNTYIGSGVPGLDVVLKGGYPAENIYLIQGDPGAGKTTLSLQFLLEGARQGETCVYITLSETKSELQRVATSHGWSLDKIHVHEQLVSDKQLREEDTTLYHPAEVELGETMRGFLRVIEQMKPKRVVLDSLSEIRLLSQNLLRYRKQVLALKNFFTNTGATVLLLDDRTSEGNDVQLHSVPHGVIVLERRAPLYGSPRRRLEVVKLRGVDYHGGFHDFSIIKGGLIVYPRLIAAAHHAAYEQGDVESGLKEFDELVGGGLRRGTSTLMMGPAGSGKSAMSTQYIVAAVQRGERAAMFIFDESRATLLDRSRGLGMPLEPLIESGLLTVQQIDPAELPPGEFAHLVRQSVEQHGARVVVIDSLNGYLNAMPEERFLTLHLHELLTYLGNRGVATIMVMAQHGLLGSGMVTAVDVSYLADCVILTRYFEMEGEIRKAVSVMKKRSGMHEKAIRELIIEPGQLRVGEQLRQFRGILTGVPIAQGQTSNGNGVDRA